MVESSARFDITLVCPVCRDVLELKEHGYLCSTCDKNYPVDDGIPSFLPESVRAEVSFYEEWHLAPHRAYNLQGIGKALRGSHFIENNRWFFEKVLNTAFKRERFIKVLHRRLIKRTSHATVLDLGCGSGSPDVLRLGDCVGLDYCRGPLRGAAAANGYIMLVQGDAGSLPFESEQFDCLVSSDFIGHIPADKKERLFSEMSRVLKKGGLCGHIVETDSDNFINRFAKRYGDLYQRYFIEGIGGHFGLEPPSIVLERFRAAGLEPILVIKYFSYLRDMETFIALFDNEYKEKSFVVRFVLRVYKMLCRNFPIKIIASVLLGWISYMVDIVAPLNTAEGILVLCKKNDGRS